MKEQCWKCRKVKSTVELRACDDRLCNECFEENERALERIRAASSSSVSTVKTQATSAAAQLVVPGVSDRPSASCGIDAGATSSAGATNSLVGSHPVGSPPGTPQVSSTVVVNELLSYTLFYRDRSSVDNLRKVLVSFYTPNEIAESKRILVKEYNTALKSTPFVTKRQKSSSRTAHEAEVDDILGALNHLDSQSALDSVVFSGVNYDRVPKYAPEEVNIMTVVDRQVKTDAAVQGLTEAVNELVAGNGRSTFSDACVKNITDAFDKRMLGMKDNMCKQIDQLSSICSTLSMQVKSFADEKRSKTSENDRTMNVVMIGIAEDRNPLAWRSRTDDVLRFIAGRDIEVRDAFRLGRYTPGRTRPILVKLTSFWDRRLIVDGSRKLKESSEFNRNVFVFPDESLEVRRSKMLARLKEKALREHKNAHVVDGKLYVNDEFVFSLKDGHVRRSNVAGDGDSDGAHVVGSNIQYGGN